MPSYGRQAKSGFLWGVLGRISGEVGSIPAAVILARLLTPYDFGIAAVASFFVQIAQRLTNFGFNTALARLKTMSEAHSASVFVINVLLGILVWLVLTVSAPWLSIFFKSPEAGLVIPVATLSFVIGSLGVVPSALLARDLRFKELSLIESSHAWVSSIVGVVLAFIGFGYWSLIYAQLIASVVPTTLKFIVARWRPSFRFSSAALMDLLSFGVGLHFKRMLDSAAMNLDNMVIGRVLGLAQLGLYDKAFTTANRAVSFLTSTGLVVSVTILAKFQDDAERFRSAYRKLTLSTAMVGYPLFAALIVTAQPLFLLLFGSQWVAAVVPFQVLSAAAMFRFQSAYISTAVESKGRVWGTVWLQALLVALIIAGVFVGSRWGLSGAALGVLIPTVIVTVLMWDLLRRVAGLSWADIVVPQVPAVTCSLGLAMSMTVVDIFVRARLGNEISPWLRLLTQGSCGALFIGAFVFLCPFQSVRDLVGDTVAEFAPRLANATQALRRSAKDEPEVPLP